MCHCSGLKLEYSGVQLKGNTLYLKEVVAQGHVPSASGKVIKYSDYFVMICFASICLMFWQCGTIYFPNY